MNHEFLYLVTTGRRTGLPREIEIWFTELRGRYYVLAEHGRRARWVQNISADDRVTWRIGRKPFSGRARVVTLEQSGDIVRGVRTASEEKYGWGDGLVVELIPG